MRKGIETSFWLIDSVSLYARLGIPLYSSNVERDYFILYDANEIYYKVQLLKDYDQFRPKESVKR